MTIRRRVLLRAGLVPVAALLPALLPAALLPAVLPVAAPVGAAAAPTPAPQAVFRFDGRGFGHGVGMAQVSAQAMALAGQDRERILQHFYPGTGRARRGATLAVDVLEAAPATEVGLATPNGARVGDGTRSVRARPGAVLRVFVDAAGYHVREEPPAPATPAAVPAAYVRARAGAAPTPSPSPSPSSGPVPPLPTAPPTTSPPPSPPPPSPPPTGSPRPSPSPTRTPPPPGGSPSPSPGQPPLVFDSTAPVLVEPDGGGVTQVRDTGRSYRGVVQVLSRQGLRVINLVDVEIYLRGLGEVPKSWRPAALQVQAVAARTYALRTVGQGRPLGYDICADTRCQVYIGAGNEGAATTAAQLATSGEVVTYGGRLATTYYSANAGGRTASPGEGFGGGATSPYLPSNVPAAGDVAPWTVSPAPEEVAARLGYGGRLDAVAVVRRGPSGRATAVRLDGSAGSVELTGVAVQRALGLRSSLFWVSRTTGTPTALPAPGAVTTQLPPGLLAQELAAASAAPPPETAAAPDPPTAVLRPAVTPASRRAAVVLAAVLAALAAVGQAATQVVTRAGTRPAALRRRRSPRVR